MINAANRGYVVALFFVVGICLVVAAAIWRRRERKGALPFALMMCAIAFWALGYAAQLAAAPDKGLMSLALKVTYLAIINVPVLWYMFAARYAGHSSGAPLVFVLPTVSLLIMLTDNMGPGGHDLFWQQMTVAEGPPSVLVAEQGLWFWVHTAYSYLLLVLGTFYLIRLAFVGESRLYRAQVAALLVGLFAPWIANILFIFELLPTGLMDPTPFSFAITGLALGWGLFRFRLLDVAPMARDSVFNSLNDGVIVIDAHNRIVDTNPSARAFMRRAFPELDSLIGAPVADLVAAWPELPGELVEADNVRSTTVRLPVGRHVRDIDLRISPILNRRGEPIGRVVVTSDVTFRRQAQQMQEERDAATAASLAKSAFMANMSHELRTPLNHIIGYSELLLEDAEDAGEELVIPDLKKIHGAAHHLLEAISNLLELSRLDAGMIELEVDEFDPVAIARDAALHVMAQGAVVSVRAPEQIGAIRGDAMKTREALLGLLIGAASFSGNQTLTLYVDRLFEEGHEWLHYVVADTGLKISPDEVDALFNPFTAGRHVDGKRFVNGGLVLAISQRLCRLMGGSIGLADRPDLGAGFDMRMPVSSPVQPEKEEVTE